ncbi:MAG: ammonium transporter [Capsulimonadaceae bacterium]
MIHRLLRRIMYLCATFSLTAVAAHAQAPAPDIGSHAAISAVNSGDTAWTLASTALVLIMTPGLAFFYAGMVRSKNVLSVLMQSFVACGLITVQWALFGYSLAFGPDFHHFVGTLDWAFLNHVSAFHGNTVYSPTVPHQIYCMFQLMFAIITPALISGAIVERMKFKAYLWFMLLWATFVYDPLAHMVWGQGGYLGTNGPGGAAHGALDFAGGTVVHMSSGWSAMTLAIILGRRRRSQGGEELRPHNTPLTLLGVALLWFGWFGFNSGSAISSGQLAVTAFIATHIATGTAALTWMFLDWIVYKKPTAIGFGSGAVAGLVAITPACGYVSPMGALIIGILVSVICFFACKIKNALKADDALDVFGVHGVGGMWGSLATGLFAVGALNSAGHNGFFNGGGFDALIPQFKDIGVTILMSVVGTIVLAKITGLICGGLRASDESEEMGLDLTDHGEEGYIGATASSPALAGIS